MLVNNKKGLNGPSNKYWALLSINLNNRKIIYYSSLTDPSPKTRNIVVDTTKAFFDFYLEKRRKHRTDIALTHRHFERRVSYTPSTDLSLSHLLMSSSSHFENNTVSDDKSQSESSSYFESEASSEDEEHDDKYSITSDNNRSRSWTFKCALAPQQDNLNDGGVFVCKFMDYLSREEPITFSNEDIEYFRISIGIELVKGKLFSL